jgi:hypothetical protein
MNTTRVGNLKQRLTKGTDNTGGIVELLKPIPDDLLSAVVYHALLTGAYIAWGTNRAVTAVKLTLMLREDNYTVWCNSSEDLLEELTAINDVLATTYKEGTGL